VFEVATLHRGTCTLIEEQHGINRFTEKIDVSFVILTFSIDLYSVLSTVQNRFTGKVLPIHRSTQLSSVSHLMLYFELNSLNPSFKITYAHRDKCGLDCFTLRINRYQPINYRI
jgi:hypothetical protein